MKHDRLWERLLTYINEWATAREVPGGIEVTFDQPPGVARTVEVVATLEDWDDYVGTIFGTGDPRATPLKKQILATPAEARYLVYNSYDWVPAATRELPEDHFAPGPGKWVVTDREGSITDRFADFDGRD